MLSPYTHCFTKNIHVKGRRSALTMDISQEKTWTNENCFYIFVPFEGLTPRHIYYCAYFSFLTLQDIP